MLGKTTTTIELKPKIVTAHIFPGGSVKLYVLAISAFGGKSGLAKNICALF